MIAVFSHRVMDAEKVEEVICKTNFLTILFDLVITSKEKSMPMDCIVISDNTVCGYTQNSLVDADETAAHIKSILSFHQFDKVSVKIFKDFKSFLIRAEGMNNIASVEKNEADNREEQICQIILSISL